jgi:hypothetical protein
LYILPEFGLKQERDNSFQWEAAATGSPVFGICFIGAFGDS